ncbi:SDR family oxidoreductase [Nocardia amamiensis]|uniref:SDR family oxidoreductase n=1 Tax=Nocardia amamiensis TaxID=404578 RepID=UPI00083604D7|nr:SDR family oxidoreductase [Nocardia amamiensis]
MRVFVTGASGWIGSAVVPELIAAGHQVVGLARSDDSAVALTAAGAQVRRGSLDDLDVLRDAAADSDGVIHLAFKHDLAFSGNYQAAAEADRHAVETIAAALDGSDRPLVIAGGVGGSAAGPLLTEEDGFDLEPGTTRQGPLLRLTTAEFTISLADRGIRSTVLRFAPTVHGEGDKGFVATLVAIAREKGVAGYIGDGSNRWPAVHRLDAARLARLALEHAPARAILHAVADEGVATRDIAAAIGRNLGVPVASVAPQDAGTHFGWLAGFYAMDLPASSTLTQQRLGWQPTQPGLIDDIDKGHYFQRP